jgi:histidine triad (HIT) family protein
MADVHVLVIPEKHVPTFHEVSAFSADESKQMLDFVADTGRVLGLDDYRLFVSVGEKAGQTVFHLHWHLMGGTIHGRPR